MNPWYDRWRCWIGIHNAYISVYGKDGPEGLDFTVRLRCRRCRGVDSEDSVMPKDG